MVRCTFEGWISRSNSNGGTFYCSGEYTVLIYRIPADAPQDWDFGPKQAAGEYGAYLFHGFYPHNHGPYAFTTAKTAKECATKVLGFFRAKVGKWEEAS